MADAGSGRDPSFVERGYMEILCIVNRVLPLTNIL